MVEYYAALDKTQWSFDVPKLVRKAYTNDEAKRMFSALRGLALGSVPSIPR
jgi:hypothetical protein